MYDITNYDSFADLEDWYRLVQATFATHDMPYVALVGNKSTLLGVYVLPRACCLTRNVFAADLLHMKAVKTSKHNQFAEENDFYSYVMSAKTGDQVNACFTRIAADADGDLLHQAQHLVVGVDLDDLRVLRPVVDTVTRQRRERIKARAQA